ncbi:MAG: PH domain-containing protein [Acidimicrobiia bacterium]|nr:PH domain-containing protein [Acidimicrobiia bacterium]
MNEPRTRLAEASVGLRPPRNRVERRAVTWWTLRSLGSLVVVLAGLTAAAALVEPARAWFVAALVVAAVLGVSGAAVVPRWRYQVHRWETTDQAVYAATGWFVREWRVVPISRIQSVDTVRGPLQQLLGLATVTVTTASPRSGAGSLTIVGLDRDVAVELADHLTEITQATPGDAT